ncbi:hypothetical protein UQW22_04530 [Isoptericola halotolerans]|uniref:hypothetical protein n=1 Tax=Isoptericola halotolerans TaxID=300560 RepID=UPI00388DD5EC
MPEQWTWPAAVGVLLGVVAFVTLLVPVLVVQQRRYGRETAGPSLAATLRSTATLQVVFNVLLFVPWGVLARRFLG